jgi:SOS-response transcriptional repressor LexA
MLTPKQYELLLLLNEKLDTNGFGPSYEEMAKTLGIESKSNIHRMIVALEDRGFIRRLPGRSRAIQVLKMPGGAQPCPDVLTALEDLVTTFDSGKFPLPAAWARARKALADAKRAESPFADIEAWAKAPH